MAPSAWFPVALAIAGRSQWALAPLHLGLRGNRPLPLNGVLEGNGRLGLNPLLLQGQASVSDPALAWIKGRQLQLSGFVLRYPGFDVSADLSPKAVVRCVDAVAAPGMAPRSASGSQQIAARWSVAAACKTSGVQRPNAPMALPVIWAASPSTPSEPAWMRKSRPCSRPKNDSPLSDPIKA